MAGLAASAWGPVAVAQQQPAADHQADGALPNPSTDGSADLAALGEGQLNLQENYDQAIMTLKQKMERLTREDGGQLSAAHQASLQKELDDVNRRFHVGPFAPAH
jgi:hypothetical protein